MAASASIQKFGLVLEPAAHYKLLLRAIPLAKAGKSAEELGAECAAPQRRACSLFGGRRGRPESWQICNCSAPSTVIPTKVGIQTVAG